MRRYLPWLTALLLILLGVGFAVGMRSFRVLGAVCFGMAALVVIWTGLDRMKNRRLAKWLRGLLCVCLGLGLVLFCCTAGQVLAAGRGEAPEADYLIVLGAGVNGETPSRCLRERLEAAEGYLNAHPETIAVLTGGQGTEENISEAECMFRWLTARGIDPERLLREDRATTTQENFRYSFALLGRLPEGSVAVCSNDFHLCRARLIAEQQGIRVQTLAAPSGDRVYYWYMIFRETVGVWYSLLFG